MHGTMREVIQKHDNNKPLLLYMSGDDKISKKFETEVLTKDGIIMIMVRFLIAIVFALGWIFRLFRSKCFFKRREIST